MSLERHPPLSLLSQSLDDVTFEMQAEMSSRLYLVLLGHSGITALLAYFPARTSRAADFLLGVAVSGKAPACSLALSPDR